MVRRTIDCTRLTRRQQLVASSAVLGGTLAGCLGDDEELADDVDDGDDMVDDEDDTVVEDDDDPIEDDGDDDDVPADDTAVVELQDVTAHWIYHGDLPPDIQHNNYAEGGGISDNAWGMSSNYQLVVRSVYDNEIYGMLIDDWSYSPGVLEFSLHDDFYWWSGDQVTVDDYLMQLDFQDYLWGGDDLDAFAEVVSRDRVDDNTLRFALGDSWHEDWAFEETILETQIAHSRVFYEPWLEQFEDAPDLDAVEDIRDDVNDDQITDDERLVHTNNTLFEFRYDGSIGEVTEESFTFELVPEKNGNVRHFANPDNHDVLPNVKYHHLEIRAYRDETRIPAEELFDTQEKPMLEGEGHPDYIVRAIDRDLDFEADVFAFRRGPNDMGGMQFNHRSHPGDNPHFRRAMAYLTDNTTWDPHPEAQSVEYFHPYLSDEELFQWHSDDVIDALTDYGYDEMRFDDAETELVNGGFEQDADGNWLFAEDGEEGMAGEPMDFDVHSPEWMVYVADHGSDWIADLDDFGISTTWFAEDFSVEDDWTFMYSYTGGTTPDHAFNFIFNDEVATWSRRYYNIPSTVLAPPFLETAEAGASMDDWEEYDTAAMADRLPVTTDEEIHRQLSDELLWVTNQLCPHYSTAPALRQEVANVDRWHWPSMEDTPVRWWNTGKRAGARVLQYHGD